MKNIQQASVSPDIKVCYVIYVMEVMEKFLKIYVQHVKVLNI